MDSCPDEVNLVIKFNLFARLLQKFCERNPRGEGARENPPKAGISPSPLGVETQSVSTILIAHSFLTPLPLSPLFYGVQGKKFAL